MSDEQDVTAESATEVPALAVNEELPEAEAPTEAPPTETANE